MKLTFKNKNKKGGLFSFKKKSPAKTTNSPKQQSFTNKLRSKLSEFFGINDDMVYGEIIQKSNLSEFIGTNVDIKFETLSLPEGYQPPSKLMRYFKVCLNHPFLSKFLVFYIPLIILAFKIYYNHFKSLDYKSFVEECQKNKIFMKQYIKLFSLILIPYLSVSKTLRQDLQYFFIKLKIKLTGKYPNSPKKEKKIIYTKKNRFFKSIIIDFETAHSIYISSKYYQETVDYIKNNYPDKEDQDTLIQIVNHNIYIRKAKNIIKTSLLYGSAAILGILVGEGINSFKNEYYLRKNNLGKTTIPKDSTPGSTAENTIIVKNNYNKDDLNNGSPIKQSAGGESKFYTIFLGMIGFLDDSVKNFIIPLLSNIIDQIVSFLQDPKIDPKRVLMFFLVNTVLIIFGLLFNKIKRQIKIKKTFNKSNKLIT